MKPSEDRIYVAGVRNRFSSYPSKGLTPGQLGTILMEADAGDLYRQYELFEEMEGKDTHLFSVLQTRKLAISNKDWEIVAASDSAQDKKIADFVRENLENLDMQAILLDMMDAVGKGFSIQEIMWDTSSLPYRIQNIDWCDQKLFTPNWSEDNQRLQGFRFVSDDNPSGLELPERKFVLHQYKAKSGYPEKGGLIRICAWMYLFKNYDIKDWVAFAEVFGMPLRIGKYESGATEDDKKVLIDAVANLGSDAAAIIPSSTLIELIEAVRGSSLNVYETLANFCNKEMSKAVLGQTLTTDIGATGSFAAEKGHEVVRQDLVKADAKACERTVKYQIIKPLVDINYTNITNYPVLKIHVEPPEDLKLEAEKDKVLVTMGMEIPANYLHKKYGIPQAKEGEKVIKRQPQGTGGQFKAQPAFVELKSRYKGLDSEIAKGISAVVPQYEKRLKVLKKIVQKSSGFSELKRAISKVNHPNWEFISENAGILKNGLNSGYKIAIDRVKKKYRMKNAYSSYYALQDVAVDWDLQSEGAVNFFRLQAFTVAHIEDAQLLEGMRKEIARALEDGTTFRDFSKNVNKMFDDMGVSKLNQHHLNTVFNSNIQSAYMAGKFHQLRSVGGIFPYWQYITMDDGKVRPSHQAMHLLVYRKDDPIWAEWFPPNGFGCRCDVEAVDDDDLEQGGYKLLDSEHNLPMAIGGKAYHPDQGWQKNVALSTTQFEKWLTAREEAGASLDRKPGDYGWKGKLPGAKDPGNFSGDFENFLRGLLDENNRMKTYEGKVYIPEALITEKLLKQRSKHPYAKRFQDSIIEPQEVWGIIEGDKYTIRMLKRFSDNRGLVIILKYERNILEDMELLTYTGTNDMKHFEKQRRGIAIYKK